MADLLADIGSLWGTDSASITKNSTSRKNNTELDMNDFLQLMIVQLTSQTIDDSMDTSEMMNQMLQMQMITAMTNMNDISVQSYSNSLVGKLVTIGVLQDNVLEERMLYVYGTGTYNGQQVVFCNDGKMYFLSQIMAVGALPDENGSYGNFTGDDLTTDKVQGGTKDPAEDGSYDVDPGEDGELGTEDDWYQATIGGEDRTVYVGKDGKAGTEDDWYLAADVAGKDRVVYVGADGKVGTEDDYYYAEVGDEEKRFFVGSDGVPGTDKDYQEPDQSEGNDPQDPEYDGSQGADT